MRKARRNGGGEEGGETRARAGREMQRRDDKEKKERRRKGKTAQDGKLVQNVAIEIFIINVFHRIYSTIVLFKESI